MQLINKFHKMETENALFNLGKEIDIPLWDIIRYHVYIKYYYPEKDSKRINEYPKHTKSDYISIITHFFLFIYNILFKRCENLVFTYSRYVNDEGLYYDKSALPIIKALNGNYMVIEAIREKRVVYKHIYDFRNIFRHFFPTKKIPYQYYEFINEVLISNFGENLISYKEINNIYNGFRSDYLFYKFVFYVKGTKKLIICTGNPKASIKAAKELNIDTYLVQHGGIELDEVDYSYPIEITQNSFILFSKYVLTLGDYWCHNINVPACKIISIGNDFFCNKPILESDNSILIISTIVHGDELSKLTKELAYLKPELKFIYKLHPNEFHFKNEYVEYFKKNKNVQIISNQIDTNILIAKSKLVVLIVSAVIYEALNQNKKVAVFKKINYERQLCLSKLPNIYFFNYASELFDILRKETITNSLKENFYKKTDFTLIQKILE